MTLTKILGNSLKAFVPGMLVREIHLHYRSEIERGEIEKMINSQPLEKKPYYDYFQVLVSALWDAGTIAIGGVSYIPFTNEPREIGGGVILAGMAILGRQYLFHQMRHLKEKNLRFASEYLSGNEEKLR